MSSDAAPVDPCRRNWTWRAFQLLMQNVFVFWLGYRVAGKEHLPAGGALLLVNHQSFIDPLVVAVALKRPVSYLARHNLFEVPVIGWILKNTYVMPIRRESAGTESIRVCTERLKQGYYVGIFPEGTRSSDGRLGDVKPGFLVVVRRADVPIIPVGVAGAWHAYPRGVLFPRPRTVRVVIGEPLPTALVQELSQKGRESNFVALVKDRMESSLAAAEAWLAGDLADLDSEPARGEVR